MSQIILDADVPSRVAPSYCRGFDDTVDGADESQRRAITCPLRLQFIAGESMLLVSI